VGALMDWIEERLGAGCADHGGASGGAWGDEVQRPASNH
jgi:hypothetical protein